MGRPMEQKKPAAYSNHYQIFLPKDLLLPYIRQIKERWVRDLWKRSVKREV